MKARMQSLVGENMQQVDGMGSVNDRDKVVGLVEREFVEMLPDVFSFALLQQRVVVGCEIDSVVEVSITQRGTGFAQGKEFDGMMLEGETTLCNRTMVAVRCFGCTEERAEFHDSRIEQAGVLSVQDLLCEMVKVFLAFGSVEDDIAVEKSCQDAVYIAVKSRVGKIESKRSDGTGGIFSYALHIAEVMEDVVLFGLGERVRLLCVYEFLCIFSSYKPVLLCDLLCCFVEVSCTGIVS